MFEDELVAAQLRYTGMLDTIRIRKAGFTVRIPYDQFVKRFKVLIPTGLSNDPDHKKVSSTLVESISVNTELWQAGNTQIFMKEEAVR